VAVRDQGSAGRKADGGKDWQRRGVGGGGLRGENFD